MEEEKGTTDTPGLSPDQDESARVSGELTKRDHTGFVIIDRRGVILTVSASVCQWIGRQAEDLTSHSLQEYVTAPSREQLEQLLSVKPAEGEVRAELELSSGGKLDARLHQVLGAASTVGTLLLLLHRIDPGDSLAVPGTTESLARLTKDPAFLILLDYAHDWQQWFDSEGNLLCVNAAVERISGYSVAECHRLDNFPFSIIDQQDRERFKKNFEGALSGTSGNDLEFRIRRKDDSVGWIAASWQPILTSDGSVMGHHSAFRDVSRRKAAEEQATENRRQMEVLMSNLPGMAYRCGNSSDWPMEFVSDGCEELTGYTAEELCVPGDNLFVRLIHRDDRREVEDLIQRSVARDEPFQIQYRLVDRSGREKWVWEQGRLVGKASDSPGVLEGFITDIDRQVRAEEQLRQSEEKYRTLVERSRHGLLILEPDGVEIVYANPGVKALIGMAADKLSGAIDQLLAQGPDNVAKLSASGDLSPLVEEMSPARFEAHLPTPDNEGLWLDVTLSPTHYGKRRALQVLLSDITDRKRAELALEARDKVLETITSIARRFLKFDNVSEAIQASIEILGPAADVDKVCIHLDETVESNRGLDRTTFIWRKKAATSSETDDTLPGDLLRRLRHGELVCASVGESAGDDATYLSDRSIVSGCLVPLFCDNVFAGYISLEATESVRMWSGIEQDAMKTVADTLGVALERNAVREALKESEAFWRSLFDNAPQIVFTTDTDGVITSYNTETSRTVEGDPAGRSIFEFTFQSDTERVRRMFEKVTSTGESMNFDISVPGEPGLYYSVTLGPILGDPDRVIGVTAIVNDITELVHDREALEQSRRYIESIAETVPEMLYVFDLESSRITYVNSRVKDILGLSPEEVINSASLMDFLHPDDIDRVTEHMEVWETASVAHVGTIDYRLRTKDGAYRWIRCRDTVFDRDENGRVTKLIGAGLDITEMKEAAEAHLLSEERFRSIVYSSPMGMHLYRLEEDDRLVFIGSNPAADSILEVDNNQFVGKTLEEAFPPLAETEVPARYREVIRTGKVWREEQINYEDETISGAYEVVAFRTSSDTLAVLFLDVTERIQAVARVRESESRYRSLIEDQTEFIVRWKPDGTRTFVNDNYCRYFGLTKEQALGTGFFDLVPADQAEAIREKIASLTPKAPASTDEHKVYLPSGRVAWNQWTDRGLFDDDGNLIEIQSVGRDVTLRREAEEALRANESAIRAIFRSAPVGIGVIRERKIVRVNDRLTEMLGYTQMEMLGRDTRFLYLSDEDFEYTRETFYGGISEQGTSTAETKLRRKDGTIIEVLVRGTNIDPTNPDAGVAFTAMDITERNRALRALSESEERFRTAFRTSPDSININRLTDGVYVDINEGFTQEMGYTREEVIGRSSLELDIWVDPEEREQLVQGLKLYGRVDNLQTQFRRKDGSEAAGLMSARVMILENEPHILSVTRSIQDLVEIHRAYKRAAERAQTYLDIAATLMVALNTDGSVSMINKRGRELLGYEDTDLVGRSWFDEFLIDEERDIVQSIFDRVMAGKTPFPDYFENEVVTRSGERLLIAWYNTAIKDEQGKVVGSLSSGVDITERRRMERELEKAHERLAEEHDALQQKNIALREILSQIEGEKENVKKAILDNIESNILPIVQRLRLSSNKAQEPLIEALENDLEEVTSEFAAEIKDKFRNLTPRQVQICRLIKNGYSSKEIAEAIGTSLLTVHKHREAIRDKLGIKGHSINLNSYLQSL